MNSGYLHLVSNHLPILGAFFGFLVLAYGILLDDRKVKSAAYLLFLVAAIGGAVAYATGEAAEEAVEHLAGIVEARIEAHEEFAAFAMAALTALGLASLAALILERIKRYWGNALPLGVALLAALTLALSGWTGYLGGKIRHSEFHGTATGQSAPDGD
jgi:uncharacterized membrane protein